MSRVLGYAFAVIVAVAALATDIGLLTSEGADLNFYLDQNFTCNENIICLGDAGSQGGRLTLTPDSRQVDVSLFRRAKGIALYSEALHIIDPASRKAASFSTSFNFRVTPLGMNNGNAGDGFAFVLLASNTWIGSPGAYMGVYNESSGGEQGPKTLAVEFDTFKNYEVDDLNGNHVGIDLESIYSKVVANAFDVGVIFRDGQPTYAWIDYNDTTKALEVRISGSGWRPYDPILKYQTDLFDVLEETMWVGFAAANGWGVSLYTVKDWSFTSYGLPTGTLTPSPKDSTNGSATGGGKNLINFLALSIGIPAILILSAVIVLSGVKGRNLLNLRKAVRNTAEHERMLEEMGSLPNTYSYKQLSAATGGFSEKSKLGQGGFGSVYRGLLPLTGVSVAIKRVSENSSQGRREFMAEVSIITQIRHRNIVQLLGWCSNEGKLLLVYELMPNGSLDKALFAPLQPSDPDSGAEEESMHLLTWSQRYKIVHGLAAALDYLHEGSTQQVIHRDVKSSNVMLDKEFNAKLGDFGLARMVDHQKTAATTQMAGTYGYIAPEAPFQGKFTVKTDVYAFGAVALEIACGRLAFDTTLPRERMTLVDWVWSRLSQGELLTVVDSRLGGAYDESEITLILLLGLICSHPDPNSRPSMRQVIEILSGNVPMIPVPASKPAPMYSSDIPKIQFEALLKTTSGMATSSDNTNFSEISSSCRSSSLKRPTEYANTSGPLLERRPSFPRSE
ncbi:hypothetical protein R1flu_021985 [Riccia fluitans]|uniref:non-specific serine/threonine protein kinase n=1 Tax=Riccia fluitans TaxID=41844 RepID=A0ABD1ZS28_9MARC